MLDATTLWANMIKASPGEYKVVIEKNLKALIREAMDSALKCEKASSRLAIFRTAFQTWQSFNRKLENSDIRLPGLVNMFLEIFSLFQPEIYTICVQQKIFVGHKPSISQLQVIAHAERTLKTDNQIRLSKMIQAGLKDTRPPAKKF